VPTLDTTAEAALVQTQAQRRLGVAGRFRIAIEMSELTRQLARAGLIAKLEWAKLAASSRQIEDAAGIVRLQGMQLDTPYVQQWIHALGLQEQWAAALERAL
jgi:hypothetical protein